MTRSRRSTAVAAAALCVVLGASAPATAALMTWDQAKVTALAKELAAATQDLYDTFYKQPVPGAGSMQSRGYQRLKQKTRVIRMESQSLANALEKGESREETLPIYESLMEMVRAAREDAEGVFTTMDVNEKATRARTILNQLSPYYDPDAVPLAPVAR
jgi:hypothetical protein